MCAWGSLIEMTVSDTIQFFDAVRRGDVDAISALIGERVELVREVSDHDKTGLHWAAELDQIDIARRLVDAGADLEAKTSWGASPLDWAATMGSTRVADFLLSRGASDLTLIGAAALGRLKEVASFVESGTDPGAHRRHDAPSAPTEDWPADSAHIQGDVLSDALYAAARNGHDDVVEYLLMHGADIDAKGFFGATGLHWAAINGHASTVDLLLARGADATIKDARFDATAEGWAKEGGHHEIRAMIRPQPPTA